MERKIQQYCESCRQVSTQVQDPGSGGWRCLCCESAKYRSRERTQEIANKEKPRLKARS